MFNLQALGQSLGDNQCRLGTFDSLKGCRGPLQVVRLKLGHCPITKTSVYPMAWHLNRPKHHANHFKIRHVFPKYFCLEGKKVPFKFWISYLFYYMNFRLRYFVCSFWKIWKSRNSQITVQIFINLSKYGKSLNF